jgi:capsule polysaccharide export protein KpsE/RkpR
MSLLSRAAETFIPVAVACEQAGYPTTKAGQRALRQQIKRKGFETRRVGNHFSIQVATWQAYLKRSAADDAAHRAKMAALAKARWDAKRHADA